MSENKEQNNQKVKNDDIKEGLAAIGRGLGKLGKGLGNEIGDKANKIAKKVNDDVLPVAKNQVDKARESIEDVAKNKENEKKLDEELHAAVEGYNVANMNLEEEGQGLLGCRERSVDLMQHVEDLVNSIANKPKEFEKEIAEINVTKQEFLDVRDFAAKELELAKEAAVGGGAGVAGGIAVAGLAPTAAMWIATTFGTASTGTAIATLSGAAAEKAALAWLAGGALSAGGHGAAAGAAMLAMAGPIGWGIAGTAVLTAGVLFAGKKHKLLEAKRDEIESVISNTEIMKEMSLKVHALLEKTEAHRVELNQQFTQCMASYNQDYSTLSEEAQLKLGAMVNNAKALSQSLTQSIE